MVAHRGNLNYQDCRRTLPVGFEADAVEALIEAGAQDAVAQSLPVLGESAAQSPAIENTSEVQSKDLVFEVKPPKEAGRFRVKITSAAMLAFEFWKVLGLQWNGTLEVSDHAQRRASQFLAKYFNGSMCQMLNRSCTSLYHLEFDRSGAADAGRVGDRFLSLEQRTLHGYVKECVVEGIRTGIQTSYYTCDYTTKPSLTCGPVLKHLTHGMQKLEDTMRAEAEQEEAKRLQLCYPLPPLQEGRGLTTEQREARRRLCRLWTSANHAVMHGFCLMSLQLLTGREVLRTHVFWKVMLKRVLWGVFEAMRRNTEKHDSALEAETVAPLEDLALALNVGEQADSRSTSFYEDYLHRGQEEPLASMNLYVYAMHVSSVPLHEGGKFANGEFEFVPHYGKAKSHVQILHEAPRIPYLHGITMPTKQKDPEMWAAVHVALLRKHACCHEKSCGKAEAVRHIHVFPAKGRARVVAPGADVRVVRDRTGVLAEWKATEAHMQCLADRADVSGSHTDWNFFCVRCLVTYANIELKLFVFCLSERTLMMSISPNTRGEAVSCAQMCYCASSTRRKKDICIVYCIFPRCKISIPTPYIAIARTRTKA